MKLGKFMMFMVDHNPSKRIEKHYYYYYILCGLAYNCMKTILVIVY